MTTEITTPGFEPPEAFAPPTPPVAEVPIVEERDVPPPPPVPPEERDVPPPPPVPPKIIEPTYPKAVKPDKPGGQVATVKGAEVYIPGSTMYEMGFRTNQEYLDAQQRGVAYGIHPGGKVPKGSVVVEDTISGRKTALRVTPHDVGRYGAVAPHLLTKRKLAKQWVASIVKGKQVLIPAKEAQRISLLKGKAQFEARVAAGLVPTGSFYISATEYIPASVMADMRRDAPDLHKILVTQGYQPFVRAIEKHNKEVKEFEKTHIKLADDKFMLIKDFNALSEAERTIGLQEGFGALNRQYEANVAAIAKLKPYTDNEGFIDASKYLRDNPTEVQTLRDAGLESKDIKEAIKFNFQPFVATTGLEEWWQKITKAGGDKLNIVEFQNFLRKHPELAAEGRRIALTPVPKPKKPTMTLSNYIAGFMTVRGVPPPVMPGVAFNREQLQMRDLALAEYARLYGDKTALREVGLVYAEVTVPGVYTARNWTTLSTKDKVINIAIDVASVALCLGVFKVVGIAARQLTGVTKVARVATKAGKAGNALKEANRAFATVQKVGRIKVGSPMWVKQANRVAQLQTKSMKADKLFLQQLEKIDSLSPRQLLTLEKQSGLKGLAKAIKDIGKAQSTLDKAWKKLGKLKFNPNAKTLQQIAANNRYLKALASVETAQVRLQSALGRAGSTLKPRYTPSPPAAEFKGYGMQWKAGKPAPKADASSPTTVEAIESYLARGREVTPTGQEIWYAKRAGVAVAEKPKVKPEVAAATLKLKAIYKKAKAKPTPKPKVPEVKPSAFPGIKAVVKAAPKVAPTAIPAEAFGRMTADQIAKYYSENTEGAVDAIAKTIQEHLEALKGAEKLSPFSREGIREITKAGIMEFIRAQQANLTAAETRAAVLNVVRSQAAAKPALATQAKIGTKVLVKAATSAIVKPKPRVIVKPVIKPKLKPVPVVLLPGASDKEKRTAIKDAKGAIAFNMGEVGAKPARKRVWHTLIHPWRPEDYVTVIGKAPAGATVLVEGENSAYRTAQLLYGKSPSRKISMDIGFMDVDIDARGRKIDLKFTPDPKGLTIGDITVGLLKASPAITERSPRLSGRGMLRITPKRPRLRR